MTEDTVLDHSLREPSMTAGEVEILLIAFDRSRAQFARKCGQDAAGRSRRHPPTTMTLGGLRKQLALIDDWITVRLTGSACPRRGTRWTGTPTPTGHGIRRPTTRPPTVRRVVMLIDFENRLTEATRSPLPSVAATSLDLSKARRHRAMIAASQVQPSTFLAAVHISAVPRTAVRQCCADGTVFGREVAGRRPDAPMTSRTADTGGYPA